MCGQKSVPDDHGADTAAPKLWSYRDADQLGYEASVTECDLPKKRPDGAGVLPRVAIPAGSGRLLLAPPAVEPEYITLAEVELRTSFSYDYVYNAVRRGDLPAIKKGREWRVAVKDMRARMDRDRAGNYIPAKSELRKKVSRMMPALKA